MRKRNVVTGEESELYISDFERRLMAYINLPCHEGIYWIKPNKKEVNEMKENDIHGTKVRIWTHDNANFGGTVSAQDAIDAILKHLGLRIQQTSGVTLVKDYENTDS